MFTAHLFKTLFLVGAVVGLPLAGRLDLLLSWPVLTTILSGCFLNLTQPNIKNKDLIDKASPDAMSALLLYLAGALFFLTPILDYRFGRQARPSIESLWSVVGLIAIVGGLTFRLWAIRTLGKFFTSVVMVQEGQRVIQNGPYRYLRHPSYTGAFVNALGIQLLFRSYAGLAVCFFFFLPVYFYRIAVEERTLVKELGQPYADYRAKTWRLIPFVY